MNPMKLVLPLLLAGGAAAWYFWDTVESSYEDVRWSETMRQEEPVGYIDFALDKLDANKAQFGRVRANLAAAKKEAETRRDEFTAKHANALELASKQKEVYQAAELGAGYPIAFLGEDYTKEQFVNQVTLTLTERDALDAGVDDLTAAIARIEVSRTELAERVTKIDASRVQLQTKRAVVEVQQLTQEIEDLMASVDELLLEDETAIEALPEDDDPVRSLDEFLQAAQAQEAADEEEPEAESMALQFLEG